MPVLLRCARGHEWECPAAAQADHLPCPVCGASQVATLTDPATAASDHQGRRGG
jgi:hypothetical protein